MRKSPEVGPHAVVSQGEEDGSVQVELLGSWLRPQGACG